MKVIAKHWLNYSGVWHKGGEIFDADDYEAVKDYVTPVREGFVSEVFPPDEEKPAETPRRRGRPRKTD